jgi:hypothetical protein
MTGLGEVKNGLAQVYQKFDIWITKPFQILLEGALIAEVETFDIYNKFSTKRFLVLTLSSK